MDPVNAVGIAAAVVKFADHGLRLVKSAYELYKSPSGQKSEYVELSVMSQSLSDLADAIRAKLDESQGPVGEVFLRLHGECKSTNDEIQIIVKTLKVQGFTKVAQAADGLLVVFREDATAIKIRKLKERLNQIREQMNVGLLYLLLNEAGKNGVALRQYAQQQADMIATLDRIDGTTKQFSTEIISLIDDLPVKNRREADEMVRYVLSDKWQTSKYAEQTVFDKINDREKLRKVCQSLHFESINYRETSVPKRHASTFEWIFHEPRTSEDGDTLWSDFPLWLRGESPDIYWITGKPGAGKSTLIKFISQDPRFEALLQEWATRSQLVIFRYFSWAPGANRLQKSQEGLFRTLLFEAIQKRPQLAIDIFPARWFLLQSFDENIELPAPTMDELRVGFQKFLSTTGDKFKLVLLIDGLDEFDEDHRELVHLLYEVNANTAVKICASSRPWNIFRDAYGKSPMLQLENLTQEDIKSFVQVQLQLSPGYRDFAATNQEAAYKIITDIVDKSQGVFLWVSVISGLLRDALQEGTGSLDLQATIDNLPTEVADLFRYIWNRTSERFRAEASQYFQLMRICQEHKTNLFALTLWFGNKEIPVNFDTASLTNEYLTGVIKSLERKLMSRTGGLLELVSRNDNHTKRPKHVRVNYMHRTANDWVNENWDSINLATDPSFDPFFWFVKGQALSIALTTKPDFHSLTKLTDWPSMCHIASRIPEDHPDKETIVAALDRLDNHLGSHKPESTDRDPVSSYWVNWVKMPYDNNITLQYNTTPRPDLRTMIGYDTPVCTNFLEFSARVPIPAYLKHQAQKNPHIFSASKNILHNIIFGELWFYNPKTWLNLLNFLIQEQYCPPMELLRVAKDKANRAMLALRETGWVDHRMFTYFTHVKSILESRDWKPSVRLANWLKRNRNWWRQRR